MLGHDQHVPHVDRANAARARDAAQARALDAALSDLYAALGVEPNPIPLKWCLQRLGIGSAELRLPLLPLGGAYHEQVQRALDKLGLSAVQPRHSSAA